MEDFAQYLTPNEDDRKWGLFLNVAGRSNVLPNTPYPIPDHPSGYYFSWDKWRTLHEYQINYISSGSGIMETKNACFEIEAGMLIILRPGMKHRYKPHSNTGWTENYIGFNGIIAHNLLSGDWFNYEKPVIDCGFKQEIIDTLFKIFILIKGEKPGFQQVVSGMIIKLLGFIVSFEKQKQFSGKPIEKVIEEIRHFMMANVEGDYSIHELASNYNLGYSYFRKLFKSYTGMAPHQYQIELKLVRAKEMLVSTNKSIKEISFDLGFQSIYYFSRLFKAHIGISPSIFRKPE